MALNGFTLNTNILNGPTSVPVRIFSGPIINAGQLVGYIFEGPAIAVEQNVQFYETFTGPAISLEQAVSSTFSGAIIGLEQDVRDLTAPLTTLERNKWDLQVIVDGKILTNLAHRASLVAQESNSTIFNCSFRPGSGVVDYTILEGKTVTVDVLLAAGTTRIFTGIVDIVDTDLILEVLTLSCTNRRRELVNAQLQEVVKTIGYYSSDVFTLPEDVAQELDQRLETIPESLDFDGFGTYHITPWAPKATADFTFTDSDILHTRDLRPTMKRASRGRFINQVNLKVEHRFERSYHTRVSYQWTSPINGQPCLLLQDAYDLTPKSMVQSAVDASGWILDGPIVFGPMLAAGYYRCDSTDFAWATAQISAVSTPRLDDSGNPVLDSSGNQIVDTEIGTITNFEAIYCGSANFKLSTRWAQTVSEEYTLTVKAPQSIAQFELKEQDETHAIQSEFDSSEWENYTAFTDEGLGNSYFIDRDTNRNGFNIAVSTILNRAKTTIIASHRDNTVTFNQIINPSISLEHTVELSGGLIACRGKVFKVVHDFDIAKGKAITTTQLVMTKVTGSQADSVLSTPTKPTDNPALPGGTIFLRNQFGRTPQPGMTGMVGNAKVSGRITNFQSQFRVDAGGIPPELRDHKILLASGTYDVSLDDDSLTVTYNDRIGV